MASRLTAASARVRDRLDGIRRARPSACGIGSSREAVSSLEAVSREAWRRMLQGRDAARHRRRPLLPSGPVPHRSGRTGRSRHRDPRARRPCASGLVALRVRPAGLPALRRRLGPDVGDRRLDVRREAPHRRRGRLAAPGGTRAGVGPGARARRTRDVGRVGRLQAAAGPDLHAIRDRAVRHVRERGDVRAADLSMAARGRRDRRPAHVDRRQPRRRAVPRCCMPTASARRSGCSRCWPTAARLERRAPYRSMDEPVLVHGAVANMVDAYREAGIAAARRRGRRRRDQGRGDARAGDHRAAFGDQHAVAEAVSRTRRPRCCRAGCACRGARRWKGVDRGFVLSDHADWPALLDTIAATGARRVLATHGYADVLARTCAERGLEAGVIDARVHGEEA